MSNVVSGLRKIKYIILFITCAISFCAAVAWLFDNYTIQKLFSLIFIYSFMVGAGNWGVIGYRARAKYWTESQTYKDSITILMAGIGFVITVMLFVMFIYTYYDSNVTVLTWGVGALTLGGILRL